jgi:hypothetical protein
MLKPLTTKQKAVYKYKDITKHFYRFEQAKDKYNIKLKCWYSQVIRMCDT